MSPKLGTGAVDQLPQELQDKLANLRRLGTGPKRIYDRLETELSAHGIGYDHIRSWVIRFDDPTGATSAERLGRIAELLAKSGIDPDDIGKVKAVKLSEWQGLTKDAEGEAQLHDLSGASIVLTPAWEEGPAWQPIDRAAPIKVPVPPKPRATKDGLRTAVIVPDVQIGYWRDLDSGELTPFHDETAMAACLRIVREVDPDDIIVIGDFIDLAPMSRFDQEPGFALTVQPAIDRGTLFLAELVAAAPRSTTRVYLEGNHDRRLQKSIVNNAVAAFGLRPGYTPPDTWPDLSIPHLLRLDDLEFSYVGGYPAGIWWVNENLAAIHGHRVTSAGSTAARVVDDARVSVLFGHVHRLELMTRTRQVYEGSRTSLAASVGCLCRIDGAVPSTKGSTDVFGRPVPTTENWTQGMAVVTYEEGNGFFDVELVPIFGGRVIYRGKRLEAA